MADRARAGRHIPAHNTEASRCYANARTVGRHTDGERIITEVRKCLRYATVNDLVGAVYSEMASK
jgi:hypothetical protein